MSSDDIVGFGLGVGALLLLASALGDKKKAPDTHTPQLPPKAPETIVDQKSPAQLEAEEIGKLMKGEHYPEAVSRACKVLFGLIRQKSGVEDKDTMQLIDHVFSPKAPILRFTRHDAYKHLNSHEGYYYLLKGISAAFRNPAGHENIDMSQDEAKIQIATISHLYNIVETYTTRVIDDGGQA